jgi:hypothetical protein
VVHQTLVKGVAVPTHKVSFCEHRWELVRLSHENGEGIPAHDEGPNVMLQPRNRLELGADQIEQGPCYDFGIYKTA